MDTFTLPCLNNLQGAELGEGEGGLSCLWISSLFIEYNQLLKTLQDIQDIWHILKIFDDLCFRTGCLWTTHSKGKQILFFFADKDMNSFSRHTILQSPNVCFYLEQHRKWLSFVESSRIMSRIDTALKISTYKNIFWNYVIVRQDWKLFTLQLIFSLRKYSIRSSYF